MDTLLHVALSNAIAAGVLALIAGLVCYFCRRPAVRHALWLLVLLKLVTPPLIDIAVWQTPAEPATAETPAKEEPVVIVVPNEPAPVAEEEPAALVAVDDAPPQMVVAADEPGEPIPTTVPQTKEPEPAAAPPFNWRPLLLAIWIGGSVLGLALTIIRVWRFAFLLRYAAPASAELQREVDTLAARLGLARSPRIGLLPGRLSPMLWSLGWSARLLLPTALLNRLDATGRRTLLAHELAHLRRGDHRLRLFELVVTVLFWWHPIVWWARRELHEAEEQCCDAWVLWALPQSAKTYALALVETVDFLSETPAALPALASGVGHVHDLRRRVAMIMQGTTPRSLTWRGLLGLFGLGLFLLPVMPSWGQEGPREPVRVQLTPAGEDTNKAKAELERLMAELKAKEAELMRLQAQVQEAQRRAAQAAQPAAKVANQDVIVLELVDGNSRQVIKLPAGSRVLSQPIELKAGDAVDARRVARIVELKKAENAANEREKPRGLIIEFVTDGKRQVIELPPGSRIISREDFEPRVIRVAPSLPKPSEPIKIAPPGYQGIPKPPVSDTDKRLDNLEKRLEELMRAVKEMRGEMQKGKPSGKTGVQDLELKIQNLEIPRDGVRIVPVEPQKK